MFPCSPLSPSLPVGHLRPGVAYAFGEDLDTARRIDYGADQRPIGVELLNVSAGVTLADLPDPDEIARLLVAEGVKVLSTPTR